MTRIDDVGTSNDPRDDVVLIVDDDSAIRRLFSIALNRAGFKTAEAGTGRQALEMIANNRFAAVLLDNHMPEMDGLDVIKALRAQEETATLPIILVTGAAEVSERVVGLQAGATDYLTKPVDLDELLARVRTHLRGQKAWMHKVEGHLRERAAIARALAQIKPADTPEATALVICSELSMLHELKSVAMFAFAQGNLVSCLGRHGDEVMSETVGDAIDPLAGRYLLEKAQRGPWTERSEMLRTAIGQAPSKRPSTLAFAPLVADGHVMGVLVLAMEPSDSGPLDTLVTHALSAAIDFASVAGGLLASGLTERGRDAARHALLDRVIGNHEFHPVFQPIVDLNSRTIVGFETLTRFDDGMRPDLRFIEASLLGRSTDLELATLRAALAQSERLPDGAFVSINVSPAVVLDDDGGLGRVLAASSRQLVLELTEHERVDDYGELRTALQALGPCRLSVDDAGSGFASLRHVLALEPHFVKLDLSLVRGIHTDPARQALVAGIEYFATETSARLIAEGIEEQQEVDVLQRLDVELGQGYLLGRPSPLDALPA